MSYGILFIAKGGVTLHITLYDSSYTLITHHLLYDYYIELSTLELPLDKTLHCNAHVTCETKWLDQAIQDML